MSHYDVREMRRLVSFMHISLDGFAARPSGDLDWISYDAELEKLLIEIARVGAQLRTKS